MLAGLAGFQAALAAGAPWGRAAYGGTRPGRLPRSLRAVSAATSVGFGAGSLLTLTGAGSPATRSRAFGALAAYTAVGVIANGASRSPLERAVWTPFSATLAALAWRSRTAHRPPA